MHKANLQKTTTILLTILFSFSLFSLNSISEESKNKEAYPINLYFYGEGATTVEGADLITESPKDTAPSEEIIYDTGIPYYSSQAWYNSKPLLKSMQLKGDVSITFWAVNDDYLPVRIKFLVGFGEAEGEQRGNSRGYGSSIYSDTKILNGEPTEFSVNFKYDKLREELKVFEETHWICVSIQGQIASSDYQPHRPTRIAILYYSIDYPSRAIVPLDSIEITQEVNISEKAIINANILSAFGNSDITNYTVQIIGDNVNTVSLQVNESKGIQINLTWDYKNDNAKEGNYTVLIKVKDGNGNLWQNATYFELKYEKSKDGSLGSSLSEILNDNLLILIGIFAIIGIAVLTAIGFALKRRKSK